MPRDTSAIASIEAAFEGHWRRFGLYPGASLHDEDGVLWFESTIAHLPYNAVIRSHITDDPRAGTIVERIAAGFRARGVPFMWVVRPSDSPADLAHHLARASLDLVEEAIGMELDLESWNPGPASSTLAHIVDVSGERQMSDYEELIRTYWSVPDKEQAMIRVLNRHWSGDNNPGVRLVAYAGDKPVGKLFLNLTELPDRCAIFGVTTLPEARGQGLASAMMQHALSTAKAAGARTAVLHSSHMAHSLYRRLGFVEHCRFHVYATGPVFGTHHH